MSSLPPEKTVIGIDLSSGDEISIVEHFVAVRVKRSEWANPAPEHAGERILWADGSAHGIPEDGSEFVTVLRRVGMPEVRRAPAALEFPEIDHGAIPTPAAFSAAVALNVTVGEVITKETMEQLGRNLDRRRAKGGPQ